ncbi:hypothetical protein GCM10010245_82560 [Streptomyces spectabilis]|nr:hypothetical protein GCM10010245_82560 [Streptomyces spectabilis]
MTHKNHWPGSERMAVARVALGGILSGVVRAVVAWLLDQLIQLANTKSRGAADGDWRGLGRPRVQPAAVPGPFWSP